MCKPIQVVQWTGKQLGEITEWLYNFPNVKLVQMTIKKELIIQCDDKKIIAPIGEYICVNTELNNSILALTEDQVKNCLVE